MSHTNLLPLVATLKECRTREAIVSREMFLECWDEVQREGATHLISPTLPVMAALVLHDDRFERLLNETENLQLTALVQLALDRYEQQTNPTNKLGKLLVGSIKKE